MVSLDVAAISERLASLWARPAPPSVAGTSGVTSAEVSPPEGGSPTSQIPDPSSSAPLGKGLSPSSSVSSATAAVPASTAAHVAARRRVLGPNLTTFFAEAPLEISSARGAVLTASDGCEYLDCINNVSHVGHGHPKVVLALAEQFARVNTNSRYIEPKLVEYADRLSATLPEPLDVVYMVCSGSEANELAFRMAEAYAAERDADRTDRSAPVGKAGAGVKAETETEAPASSSLSFGRALPPLSHYHVAVLDHAYHGHTTLTSALSPYKFARQGGRGRPSFVHVLPLPGLAASGAAEAGEDGGVDARAAQDPTAAASSSASSSPDSLYAQGVAAATEACRAAEAAGSRLAAFFAESVVSCGGQVDLPPAWLRGVYATFRAHDVLCVADEVQCGFGRVGGSHFWAFEDKGVVPDAVTMGKSIGNGYPMGAVVVRRAVADAFARAVPEFFATNGGNNASAAVGLAVLDALQGEEALLERAERAGRRARERLEALKGRDERVVDVRGRGLMLGLELGYRGDRAGSGAGDGANRGEPPAPAGALARFVRAHAKATSHVILSAEGPYDSVIKIKPPMCFSEDQADRMVDAIEAALQASRSLDEQLCTTSIQEASDIDQAHAALLA